jgi:hypothetical protein
MMTFISLGISRDLVINNPDSTPEFIERYQKK